MTSTPAIHYVIFMTTAYRSLAEAQETAPADLAAHLARSQALHARGTLLMAGAFLDPPAGPLSTMAICTTREAAEEYAQGDPFVLNGMVTTWTIREWADMFA